jgi:hypothetical protein
MFDFLSIDDLGLVNCHIESKGVVIPGAGAYVLHVEAYRAVGLVHIRSHSAFRFKSQKSLYNCLLSVQLLTVIAVNGGCDEKGLRDAI